MPSVRDEALAELRAILARWEAGESVEELGLTWHADDQAEPLRGFLESLGDDDDDDDYPLDGLQELTGRERTLVENLVLIRLDMDSRAVRAAARLGVRRAVDPLGELLESAHGSAREEILSALHMLNPSPSE